MEKNIKDLIIEQQQKQLEKNQELLNNSICTISNIVKDFQKTIKLVIIVNAIALVTILGIFFVNYFGNDFSSEIKEKNSNYNYNENVNKNINEK